MGFIKNIMKVFLDDISSANSSESSRQSIDIPTIYDVSDAEQNSPYQPIPIPTASFGNRNIHRIAQMRKIKSPHTEFGRIYGAKDADQFIAQATFMVDYEDNYQKDVPFKCYTPTYADMGIEHLRCYFSWRTKVRNGIVKQTHTSYIYVYIYELINCIGAKDANDAFKLLAEFWLGYRKYDSDIDANMKTWTKDFYICNNFSLSFKELVENTGLKQFYPGVFAASYDERIYSHLFQLANYNLQKSKFVESNPQSAAFIEKCFQITIKNLEPILGMYGTTIKSLMQSDVSGGNWYEPFNNAIYVQNLKTARRVIISEGEYYQYNGRSWSAYKQSNYGYVHGISEFAGYIAKKIEAQLRILSGYKHKLSPSVESAISKMSGGYYSTQDDFGIIVRIMHDSDFDDIICETVAACFVQSPDLDTSLIKYESLDIPIYKSLFQKAQTEPYATFIKMRKIKGNTDADQFCKQAELLRPLNDNFYEITPIETSTPTFNRLNNNQLRTYITWRTKYQSGDVSPVPYSYVLLYAFEIINEIQVQGKDSAIQSITSLFHAYRYVSHIERILPELLRDYYICNSFDSPFGDLVKGCRMETAFPNLFFGDESVNSLVQFYGKISSYKILGSKFYLDENLEMLEGCFCDCLHQTILFFAKNGIDFRKVCLIESMHEKWWSPFRGAVYNFRAVPVKKTVKLTADDIYTYSGSEWSRRSSVKLDMAASHLIGFILKRMEAKMREIVKFKYKLSADGQTMAEKIPNNTQNQVQITRLMKSPDFGDLIDRTVVEYFQKNHPRVFSNPDAIYEKPVKVNIDFSKLAQIRNEASEIQGKLLIQQEEAVEAKITANESSVLIFGAAKKQSCPAPISESATEWDILIANLTDAQKDAILIILTGQVVSDKLQLLSAENHLLTEVLLESINEAALEHVGDNVIETGESPVYVYDEYIENLNRALKGVS